VLTPAGEPWPHEALQMIISLDGHVTEVGHFTRTDEDGYWTYPDLPAEGAMIRRLIGYTFTEVPVRLDAENLYREPETGTVIGRVLEAGGEQPVSEFEVTVLPAEEADASGMRISEFYARQLHFRDAGGHFELLQMPLGVPMRLQVTAEGYSAATVGPVEAGPENDPQWPLTIELTPTGR
jgi:hypothetical protein